MKNDGGSVRDGDAGVGRVRKVRRTGGGGAGKTRGRTRSNPGEREEKKCDSEVDVAGESVGEEGEKAFMWEYAEVVAVLEEVQSRKSVDTGKLFGGPSGYLPDELTAKSTADVKGLVDRLKASFDAAVAPWAPKCGVLELMAALTSEAVYLRRQRLEKATVAGRLDKCREEREEMEAARVDLEKDIEVASAHLVAENKKRAEIEGSRVGREEAVAKSKREHEFEVGRRAALEKELVTCRLSELDARRRLDRMRLKVAALRGEMVTTTVDGLARPPPNWLGDVDESVMSAESGAAGSESGKGGKSAASNKSVLKTTPQQDADGEHVGDGDVDMKNSDAAADSADAAVAIDKSDSSAKAHNDEDAELDEDVESVELRLLRNRLDMCETEAREWKESAEAERVALQLVSRARTRLEEELVRARAPSGKIGGGSDRRPASKPSSAAAFRAAAAKSRAQAQRVSLDFSATDLSPMRAIRKSRKRRPSRSLVPADV